MSRFNIRARCIWLLDRVLAHGQFFFRKIWGFCPFLAFLPWFGTFHLGSGRLCPFGKIDYPWLLCWERDLTAVGMLRRGRARPAWENRPAPTLVCRCNTQPGPAFENESHKPLHPHKASAYRNNRQFPPGGVVVFGFVEIVPPGENSTFVFL